ncbi:conserved protein of unknown function [Kyrpidia spormannii]|uniref:UPF0473 protein COOX1_2270 n=1 Tax=Kyrpidia spormannii TaxID=2055160 RepID=A0A6F9EB81_9BACL|nr:conserved protein of unknown function [Kyrpidia spormannii]
MASEDREDRVVLTDEEGGEHPFRVIDVIEVEGKIYAILLPDAGDVGEAGVEEAVIFRVEEDENGEEVLYDIEDDDEWERVAEAYSQMAEEE